MTTFERFYADEYPRVLKHALWLERDLHAAEDLTQEAFLAAHRRWAHVSSLDWPLGWLHRVVSNRSVSRFRRSVNDARGLAALGRRRVEIVDVAEDRADLWDAVRRLPSRQAQTIALFYGCGYTAAETAAILGCSEETVRTHLKRGRRALTRVIGTEDHHEGDE